MITAENKIKYQIENLPKGFLENKTSNELITVTISAGSGLYEDLQIGNGDLILDCTMEWNTGSYKYEVPISEIITLLMSKPFSEINHEDLQNYDRELYETKDGNLVLNSLNKIEFENTEEILELLVGTDYELSEDELDDAESVIEDKMNSFYSDGWIGDSDIRFYSLFELDFDSEDNGSFSINWHYHDNYYDLAKNSYNNDRYEECIDWSKKFLLYEINLPFDDLFQFSSHHTNYKEASSKIKDTFLYLAYSYENLESYKEAIKYYKEYVKLNPNDDFGHAHLAICFKYLDEKIIAIESFRKAIELNPHNIYAITHCAEILVAIGDHDQALDILNKGIKDNPTQPKSTSRYYLFQQKGEIFYVKEDWENSISSYEDAVKIDNTNGFPFIRLAYGYYNTKKYSESLEAFQKSIELDDRFKDAYTYYYMGEAAKNIDHYVDAISYYKQAINFNNNEINPYAYSGLGYSLLMLEDFSPAVESYLKATSSKWTYQYLGRAYFGLGDYNNALTQFEKVIEMDPNYKWAYHWHGDTLFQLKRFDKALLSYEKLIELDPEYPTYSNCTHISTNTALLYYYNQDFDSANKYFENGQEYDKGELWKHYYAILASKNIAPDTLFIDPVHVKSLDESTLILNGEKTILAEALYKRGTLMHYYQEGDNKGQYNHEIPLRSLTLALELNPDNYEAYYHRAVIISGEIVLDHAFTKEGLDMINIDSAIQDLKKCIELYDYLPAYKLLITLLKDEDQLNEIIKKGNDLFSNDWTWWSYIGKAYHELGLLLKAKDAYEMSIELYPDYSYEHDKLGTIYLELDKPKEAIKSFQEAIRIDDWNEAFRFNLSKAYLLNNDIEQAEIEIKATIKSYSGENNYFLQYAKIIGEKYKSKHPKLLEIFTNYVHETLPHEARYDENKKKIKQFLNNCDKHRTNCDLIFQYWELFFDVDIEDYLKYGSYNTMVRLSKNKSLTKEQLMLLMENGNFTIVENITSNPLFSEDDINKIIEDNDDSYSYSFKLLGIIDNPNCTNSHLNQLSDNKYSWVKKKVFTRLKDYKEKDLEDRYKLLGLIENDSIDKEFKELFKNKLKDTDRVTYNLQFDLNHESLEEYIYSEMDFDSTIDELSESITSKEESWHDHCAHNWFDYGESEYGLNTTILPIVISGPDYNESLNISFGDRDSHITNVINLLDPGVFIFEAISSEVGGYTFDSMELEFEFRPEFLSLEVTDLRELLSGLEYYNPQTDEDYYSSGELEDSTTKSTDIRLGFKTNENTLWINHYEDLFDSLNLNTDEIDAETIHNYFKGLL